ncbi:MAG: TAT-variant-translocated molybdopterin oxidoreductase [Chitinophagaceae bacterium]|jgi:molybdopterin-containing oxidoreductase family iron-sulfur binding subunit|nr:TAT-variant-translocated molybdopterin oxidoreductase [Chitinophagaceae bacterium]
MSDKKYWQSFGELNNAEGFKKLAQNEFQEDLPTDEQGWLDAKAPRRDFLKYLGFTTAAASLAASCEAPVQKAIPFANQPENLVPGVAKYYATTYVQDGDVLPIIAKVRDGRPIKIEGNKLCNYTKGGTSARAQASVLDLYDSFRLPHPKRKVSEGRFEEIPTYAQVDKLIGDELAKIGTAPVVFLSTTITSPTTKQIISEFLAKYPGSRHVQADADSYSGMLLANEASFGRRAIPSYHFENAKVIVSLGADFLGTWLNPVEFASQWVVNRKIDEAKPAMSKHYQFESYLTQTGSNADERFTHRPSETGAVAMAILSALGGAVSVPNISDAKLKAGIAKVAADLKANGGLVISGSNDVNVQSIVNAINNQIGAYGKSINWSETLNIRQGIDKDLVDLVSQMNAGQVGALFIYGANPAYTFYNAAGFKEGMKKVRLAVSFNSKLDETTELCHFAVPAPHYLESWGDTEPKSGYISFIQPTINPVFKTRPYQTSLMKWSGNTNDYDSFFKTYWEVKLGKQAFNKALQDGVLENGQSALPGISQSLTDTIGIATVTPSLGAGAFNSANTSAAASGLATNKQSGKYEIVLYQTVAVNNTASGANPWLLELPDPVTKATWDNYAMIPLAKANEMGLFVGKDSKYEYFPSKPVLRFTYNNQELDLPVLVIPGMNANTIAIAVGYGRSNNIGVGLDKIGKNVNQLAIFNGTTIDFHNPGITVSENKVGEYKIAQTQIHNSYENRTEVVKETTMATFLKNPKQFKEEREHLHSTYAPQTGDYRTEGTLYPDYPYPGPKWGMAIDMNSCMGCNACVVACHSENNVPVVGKKEVMRYHDMHWLRIDRYFVSKEDNPDDLQAVVFQPMLCQHCDNAPCENVCPVAATMHSSEGINQMIYNRCIGTRYCANNCPYKVRRFNWADYMGADSFDDNQRQVLEAVVLNMNDDLTRMVLNPDVTVRSRGVMEKCSFCVQRTQEAKLTAKKENRQLKDNDVASACQSACPTNAITFGNVNDKESAISKVRADNQLRTFYVIEQIHTLPNVTYLAKIRNTDQIITTDDLEAHAIDDAPAAVH